MSAMIPRRRSRGRRLKSRLAGTVAPAAGTHDETGADGGRKQLNRTAPTRAIASGDTSRFRPPRPSSAIRDKSREARPEEREAVPPWRSNGNLGCHGGGWFRGSQQQQSHPSAGCKFGQSVVVGTRQQQPRGMGSNATAIQGADRSVDRPMGIPQSWSRSWRQVPPSMA